MNTIDQTSRINAAICYFFLGPIMLLARKGTPFAEPFVRAHARMSSYIFCISLVLLFLLFQLKPLLQYQFFGINIFSGILIAFVFCIFVLILISAYKAYQGVDAKQTFRLEGVREYSLSDTTTDETEKTRILLSFFPILGIIISTYNPTENVLIGRKVGNFMCFLILIFTILFHSSINTINFIILVTYIIIIVSTGVQLFVNGKFLGLGVYKFIPTYHMVESAIVASMVMSIHFIKVAFGGEKKYNFSELFSLYYTSIVTVKPFTTNYWTHPGIFGIPFVNLLALPTIGMNTYKEYRGNATEGIFLTVLCGVFLYFGKLYWIYLLIFPIVTLMAFSRKTQTIHAPITSFIRLFHEIGIFIKSSIASTQESTRETVVINPTELPKENLQTHETLDISKNP